MTESQIQKKILDYLRKAYPGAVVWKLSEQTLRGVPDIFFAFKGFLHFFEVKKPGGDIRMIQKVRIRELNDNKVNANIVFSVDEVHDILMKEMFDIQKPLY